MLTSLTAGSAVSLATCLLIILSAGWHGHLSHDHTQGVQKFHTEPTPRIGGLAILLGGLAVWYLAPADVDVVLAPLWLAGLPAFAFGFAEDLTRRVGVRERLLASMAGGILAWSLTGISLTRLDVWGLDSLLIWAPFSVIFTAFAIGGITNAFNIIDGFNGLAAGTVLVCLGGLGFTAHLAGDSTIAYICLLLAGVTAGFLLVNFPMGKLFLGDGGAYLLGFWVAWLSVLVPMRNPDVSPWVSVLICAYPLTEVLFSIYRRKFRRRDMSPGAPDRLHLHSLVKNRIIKNKLRGWAPHMRNSAVSPPLWLLAALPAGIAPWIRGHTTLLIVFFLAFFSLYVLCYGRLIRFAKND